MSGGGVPIPPAVLEGVIVGSSSPPLEMNNLRPSSAAVRVQLAAVSVPSASSIVSTHCDLPLPARGVRGTCMGTNESCSWSASCSFSDTCEAEPQGVRSPVMLLLSTTCRRPVGVTCAAGTSSAARRGCFRLGLGFTTWPCCGFLAAVDTVFTVVLWCRAWTP